jgi:CRP-like cAMP-binding protein
VANNENRLIELLPGKDRERVLASCDAVQLGHGEVLCECATPTRHVYFPVDGSISLVTQTHEHSGIEVGMIGREGMLGAQLVLGVMSEPLLAQVQGPGMAWRIGTLAFRRELAASTALRNALNRYIYVLMAQLARSAACLRHHQIGPRLARWLLMSQDRAHADHFHVTHEALADRLGVRRVGVTHAAGTLQDEGLIAYHRGAVSVLDRGGLEAAACACYASDQRTYAEVMTESPRAA